MIAIIYSQIAYSNRCTAQTPYMMQTWKTSTICFTKYFIHIIITVYHSVNDHRYIWSVKHSNASVQIILGIPH